MREKEVLQWSGPRTSRTLKAILWVESGSTLATLVSSGWVLCQGKVWGFAHIWIPQMNALYHMDLRSRKLPCNYKATVLRAARVRVRFAGPLSNPNWSGKPVVSWPTLQMAAPRESTHSYLQMNFFWMHFPSLYPVMISLARFLSSPPQSSPTCLDWLMAQQDWNPSISLPIGSER